MITTPPVDMGVRVGENATFTCTASGEPVPTITWFFGDQPLSSDDKYTITESSTTVEMSTVDVGVRVSTLVVMEVMEEDGGMYTCQAANDHANVMEVATLQPLSKFVMCVVPLLCHLVVFSAFYTCSPPAPLSPSSPPPSLSITKYGST